MKTLILIIALSIITGCSNDNNNFKDADNIDNGVSIFLKSTEGSNLINTSSYNSDNFKIYYKINNETIEINNPVIDYPRNFFISTETNPISMKLFLNDTSTEEFPETLIKWNENDTDTLKASFDRGIENNEDYVICKKIWLNNILVWDTNTPAGITGREITITK